MATQASLAIRRDEAYARIIAATKKLAKGVDAGQSNAADIRHRDPAIEQIMRLEEVADTLEALAKAYGKAIDTPAVEEAKQEADAPLTVETVATVPATKAKTRK